MIINKIFVSFFAILKAGRLDPSLDVIDKDELIDINDVYYPDPLAVFSPPRETKDYLVERNEMWKHVIGNRVHQLKFVTALLNTKLVVPFVPKFGERIERSNDCWVFLVYNSDTERHYGGIKSLLTTTNAYFYERCGVSAVDLAYPSNYDMFSPIVKETPAMIFKYPTYPMINFYLFYNKGPLGSLQLFPLEKWGKLYDSKQLMNDTVACLEDMNILYEASDTNLKFGSLFMEHYTTIEKLFLRKLYITVVNKKKQEAYQKVYDDGHQWVDEINFRGYMNAYEEQLYEARLSSIYENNFLDLLKETPLKRSMREAIRQFDTKRLVEMGIDVQKLKNEKFVPQEQPNLRIMLEKWFEIYNAEEL